MKKATLSTLTKNQTPFIQKEEKISFVKKDEYLEKFCQNVSQLKEQTYRLSFIMSEINSVLKNSSAI